LVRHKHIDNARVIEADPFTATLPGYRIGQIVDRWIANLPRFRGQYHVRDWWRRTVLPQRWFNHWSGIEDFSYRHSWNLLNDRRWYPDAIHLHNLHGDYFDLRALTGFTKHVPVIWTLHDTWAFTGHCAYFINCRKWLDGCGGCPDLRRPPSIVRDNTARNWTRKQDIYSKSHFAIAVPSTWLSEAVRQSILKEHQCKTINNAVDRQVFNTNDRQEARRKLGLPHDAYIAIFSASGEANKNPYKDYSTVRKAIQLIAGLHPAAKIIFLSMGQRESDSSDDERMKPLGFIRNRDQVALYYKASDVLLHAANAENRPLVILEALACGTPVIATSVGGIPEQISHGINGFLVPSKDSNEMARYIAAMIDDPLLRKRITANTIQQAEHARDIKEQVKDYLDYYEDLRRNPGIFDRASDSL
jgi:glycosyltransferase involved in cell wall biosynthesis